MASRIIYPPIVSSFAPAFTVNAGYCRINFSLSRASANIDNIKSIHISVVNQKTGVNVVNTNMRRAKTGIIILSLYDNDSNTKVGMENDQYYIDISSKFVNWEPGVFYGIQIRLSEIDFNKNDYSTRQSQWEYLNLHSNSFSEWSTVCVTKATDNPQIKMNLFEDDSLNRTYLLNISSLTLTGNYKNNDLDELLDFYNFSIYEGEVDQDNLLEKSDDIYPGDKFNSPNAIYFQSKLRYEDTKAYTVVLDYTTINKFSGSKIYHFEVAQIPDSDIVYEVRTIDDFNYKYHSHDEQFFPEEERRLLLEGKHPLKETSLGKENEEGCIAYKLKANTTDRITQHICVSRADERDNFKIWTDIKIIDCDDEDINDLPIFYDYTVESGIHYKYIAQEIKDIDGIRSVNINIPEKSVVRDFEHTYILGAGGRQLKLNLSNTLNSYGYTLSEAKVDTIGGIYPYISRNGNTKYRTLPIGGIISFNMDDQGTFIPSNKIGNQYDRKKEFDFREEVIEFLQDGKPKLYKSATEGNIIIRLMNVSTIPNQSLGRLISTFSATGYEIAENSMDNYLKYNFYSIPNKLNKLSNELEIKVGQIKLNIFNYENIIKDIYKKYEVYYSTKNSKNITSFKIKEINNLSIEFQGKLNKVALNEDTFIIGNKLIYNGSNIIINNSNYCFDESISFNEKDSLYLSNYENEQTSIIVNFLYKVEKQIFNEDSNYITKQRFRNISQLSGNFKTNSNLFNYIYRKHYIKADNVFKELINLEWTSIESTPGAVFEIKDSVGTSRIEINKTGYYNLSDLTYISDIKYCGIMRDGELKPENADILVNYMYNIFEGEMGGYVSWQ